MPAVVSCNRSLNNIITRLTLDVKERQKKNDMLHAENESLREAVVTKEEEIMAQQDLLEYKLQQSLKTISQRNMINKIYRKKNYSKKTEGEARDERDQAMLKYDKEISETERRITDLEKTVQQLQAASDGGMNGKIKTFKNGRYSKEKREVCMTLLRESNVSS